MFRRALLQYPYNHALNDRKLSVGGFTCEFARTKEFTRDNGINKRIHTKKIAIRFAKEFTREFTREFKKEFTKKFTSKFPIDFTSEFTKQFTTEFTNHRRIQKGIRK